MILKDQNTRDHSACNYREQGSHARGVYSMHTVYLAHENSKGEGTGRSRHKNIARGVRNLEERNTGTKGKSLKQGLTSAKDLTIELPEGREFSYHRLD